MIIMGRALPHSAWNSQISTSSVDAGACFALKESTAEVADAKVVALLAVAAAVMVVEVLVPTPTHLLDPPATPLLCQAEKAVKARPT